jgi:cardiolipin synthase
LIRSWHLGQDTSELDDRAALKRFRKIAKENRVKFDAGEPDWQGIAFAILSNPALISF